MNSFISPSTGFLEECPQPFVLSNSPESSVEETPFAVACEDKCTAKKSFSVTTMPPPKMLISVDCEEKINSLIGKWDLYYHLPYVKEWDINSYTVIMKNIDTVEKLVAINKHTPDLIIKQCMLFVMKTGITPRWEDPKNKNGGCFSFKIINKFVVSVWKLLFYSMCGETIFEKPNYNSLVNGITISPKKNFCIIKIWMENCTIQDPNLIVQIPNLIKQGCIFNKHDINK